MANIHDIMNNPNFGRRMATDRRFREFFESIDLSETLAHRLSYFKFNSEGELSHEGYRRDAFRRNPGEGFGEYLSRSFNQIRAGRTQTRLYSPTQGSDFMGGQTNWFFESMARRYGIDFEVSTYHMQPGISTVDVVKDFFGLKSDDEDLPGLVRVDDDKVIMMRGRRHGKLLTNRQLSDLTVDIMGGGKWSKRLSVLTADREFGFVQEKGSPELKVGVFQPDNLFNPFKHIPGVTSQTIKENQQLANAVDALSEGKVIMTPTAIKQSIDHMTRVRDEIYKRMASATAPEKRRLANQLTEIDNEIKALRQVYKSGVMPGGGQIRVMGAKGLDGDTISFAKGDFFYVTKQQARHLARQLGISDNDDVIDTLSFLISKSDIKPNDIKPGRLASPFFVAFRHKPGKVAYTNSLTHSIMGYHIDLPGDNGSLLTNLRTALSGEIQKLKSGDTSRLMGIIKDLKNLDVSDLPADEAASILESQSFARQVELFILNGGDLTTNSTMMSRALNILDKEYFHIKRQPGTQGKPKKITIGGQESPLFDLRIEMPESTQAHVISVEDLRGAGIADAEKLSNLRPGSLGYSQSMGRWVFNTGDFFKGYSASGGSDWDDTFDAILRYDPKEKKLLRQVLRNPNALGEFQWYNAHIATDPNLPKAIKDKYNELEAINTKIANTKNKKNQKEIERLVNKSDQLKDELNAYFTGTRDIVGEDGKVIRIGQIDMVDTYAAGVADSVAANEKIVIAPKGHTITSASIAAYRDDPFASLKTSKEYGGWQQYHAALRRAKGRAASAHSLFQFVGHDYIDYFAKGLYHEDPTLTNKLKSIAKASKGQKLTNEELFNKINANEKLRGALGHTINRLSFAENMAFYLNSDNFLKAGASPEAAKAMQQAVYSLMSNAKTGLFMFDREAIIDAFVQSGADNDLMDIINGVLDENIKRIGNIVREVQSVATRHGFTGGFGIDPLQFGERADSAMSELLLQGYGKPGATVDDLLLSPTSKLAYQTRLWMDMVAERENLSQISKEIVLDADRKLLEQLSDFTPTAKEAARAKEFVDKYLEDIAAVETARQDSPRMERLLRDAMREGEEAVDNLVLRYSKDSATIKALGRLRDWGLFEDSEALHRQIATITKMSLEESVQRGRTSGILDVLRGVHSIEDIPQLSNIYHQSIYRMSGQYARDVEPIVAELSQMNLRQIQNKYFKRTRLPYGIGGEGISAWDWVLDDSKLPQGIDRRAIYTAIRDRLSSIHSSASSAMFRAEDDVVPHLSKILDRSSELIYTVNQGLSDQLRTEIDNLVPGIGRYEKRLIADSVAEDVAAENFRPTLTNSVEAMRRIDSQYMGELLSKPGFRKGLLATGAFMAFGLLWNSTQDRTPEEMQGPALLPGGSAYETNHTSSTLGAFGATNIERASTGGVMYRVNMNGRFDPDRVSNSINQITGSPVNTRIYQSRPTYEARSSASEIMNSLIG